MLFQSGVDVELHHLGVHQDELQLRGVLLVEQRGDDGVQAHGLALPRCARHEQVGGFGEVEHEDLVRDGAPQGHGQGELGFLRELLRGDDRVHGHDLRLFVGHLYPDGAFARYGGDDADALGGQAQHDVRLQVAYLRDADARLGHDFVQRDGGSHGGLDGGDFDAVVAQRGYDFVLVGVLLVHVDDRCVLVGVGLQQVERGELVVRQVECGVVFAQGLHVVARLGCFRVLRGVYLQFRAGGGGRVSGQVGGLVAGGGLHDEAVFAVRGGFVGDEGFVLPFFGLVGVGFFVSFILSFHPFPGHDFHAHGHGILRLGCFRFPFEKAFYKRNGAPERHQAIEQQHAQQQHEGARHADVGGEPAADGIAVLPAGREEQHVLQQRREGEAQEHRAPHEPEEAMEKGAHDGRAAHVDQPQPHGGEEPHARKHRQAKPPVDAPLGHAGSRHGGPVLDFVAHALQFAPRHVQLALVGGTREEVGDERQADVEHGQQQEQSCGVAGAFIACQAAGFVHPCGDVPLPGGAFRAGRVAGCFRPVVACLGFLNRFSGSHRAFILYVV